jgi:Putative transposase
VSGENAIFHELTPTNDDIIKLVELLSQRIFRSLKPKGYPVDNDFTQTEIEEEALSDIQSASLQSLIALGERRGKRVRRIGVAQSANFEGAILEGERCATHRGFSLHGNVSCEAHEREKLEHMVRYIARPPVAMDRLAVRPDGLISYRMKKKYRDGTEMLLFSPLELIEKLAAIVPRPRVHTTRYHGLFAPHSKNRGKVVLGKTKTVEDAKEKEESNSSSNEKRMSWAKLLNRVFKIDVTQCQYCRGDVKVVAAVLQKTAIEQILKHLGLPNEVPVISPARAPPQIQIDDFHQIPSQNFNDF